MASCSDIMVQRTRKSQQEPNRDPYKEEKEELAYYERTNPRQETRGERIKNLLITKGKQVIDVSTKIGGKAQRFARSRGYGMSSGGRIGLPSGFGKQAGLSYGVGLMNMNFGNPFNQPAEREQRRKRRKKAKEPPETDWWNFGF